MYTYKIIVHCKNTVHDQYNRLCMYIYKMIVHYKIKVHVRNMSLAIKVHKPRIIGFMDLS